MKVRGSRWIYYLAIIIPIAVVIFLYYKFLFIREVVTIIFVAFILSYALKPIYKSLCKKLRFKKSTVAILLLASIFLAVFAIAMTIIPKILGEDILSNFDGLMDSLNNSILYSESGFISGIGGKVYEKINEGIAGYSIKFSDMMKILSRNLIAIIIIPIVAYYFLAHGEYLANKLMLIFPVHQREMIKNFTRDIDKILSRYVLSQIELSIIVMIMTFALLTILRVKFAIVLAIINGLFNIIPYFGPILGMLPALIIALMDNPLKFILTLIALGAVQQIEGNLIAPQLTASSTDIHPLIIIILLVLGEKLGGVVGMILIVPLFVIIKVVYDDLDYYLF